MSRLHTNIYKIENLDALSATYRLSKIRGLSRGSAQYYRNQQMLINRLSRRPEYKSPVTIVDVDEQPYLVLPDAARVPESPYLGIGQSVYFDAPTDSIPLDFVTPDAATRAICQRFLDFSLQGELWRHQGLWQPKAGAALFDKEPTRVFDDDIAMYRGFTARSVPLPDGGFGVAVDIRHRFLSAQPLPAKPSRFDRKHCVRRKLTYRMGHQWYDIHSLAIHDLNVSEVQFSHPATRKPISLLDYLLETARKPLPEDLAALPSDAGVLLYKQNGMDRFAPAALCYPIEDTETGRAARHHRRTILDPGERRHWMGQIRNRYFDNLRFGKTPLTLSQHTWTTERSVFPVPAVEFGHGKKVGVDAAPDVEQVALHKLGSRRQILLRDSNAGVYEKKPFDRQYYIVPESVMASYGPVFISDLKQAVAAVYPEGGDYSPEIVTYPDRGPKTFVEQGDRILASVKDRCRGGYALVLIHDTERRAPRQHDRLAAMVIGELRKLDVYTAVHHTTTPKRCYELAHDGEGNPFYRARSRERGLLAGYLRGVALNKVLLPNERWPFVLAQADQGTVTVGIDVKAHVAGFTFVYDGGRRLHTEFENSQQKERLDAAQLDRVLQENLQLEFEHRQSALQSLVVHRDGKLFDQEEQGIQRAVGALKESGVLAPEAAVNLLEIRKTSRTPLRLFDRIQGKGGRRFWANPRIGSYLMLPDDLAYLSTTGHPFKRPGTANPLQVNQTYGDRPFADVLEELYRLTHLTWTKPDDCSRVPITLRLTDVRLAEEASEYAVDEIANYANAREAAS